MHHDLTPEEDSVGHPDDVEDEIDDLLPADLWFRRRAPQRPAPRRAPARDNRP